ncbi:hypothetical protein ACFQVD_26630 [Streptosporangium amethystogenes subsp. fukuiense]|uniref:Uncharacterized protein n=1 Tax=Streptosporangium amethystogenes subsp. fukuiense TaxID=698418 RepID=A0ABW2T6B7_9ACTN
MSIYATWLSIDDESHIIGECAQYARATAEEARAAGGYAVSGDRYWLRDRSVACSCGQQAPIIYEGSHINPSAEDPRGGAVLFCAIPNHCHPSVRGTDTDDGPSVNYGRLAVYQDDGESCTLVLDRKQIAQLRDTLTEWLDSRDPEEAL